MAAIDLDLDALAGGEVWVQLAGQPTRFYAHFVSADADHYDLIRSKRAAEWARWEKASALLREHAAAVTQAQERGEAPPVQPAELQTYGSAHPDYYSGPDYERDLFGLLTRIWRASESMKPEGEREAIDENVVRRRLSRRQAEALLERLWSSRFAPRASVPAVTAEPATAMAAAQPAAEPVTPTKRRRSAEHS